MKLLEHETSAPAVVFAHGATDITAEKSFAPQMPSTIFTTVETLLGREAQGVKKALLLSLDAPLLEIAPARCFVYMTSQALNVVHGFFLLNQLVVWDYCDTTTKKI
ncbi:MAG: hypothetical protein Q8R36_02500 [bacterium]|nr:hypothetical protein [bacterium]